MLLKKPRFWDYKYISFLAIVLSPLSFFVNIFNYIKLKISKKKIFFFLLNFFAIFIFVEPEKHLWHQKFLKLLNP